MARLTKDEILEMTDGGIKLFQMYLPDLQMVDKRSKRNVDSIISKGKNCLSVWKWSDKYWFKDYSTGVSGNIFSFVAILNKLDSNKDFKKVLDIIEKKLDIQFSSIPEDKIEHYLNCDDFGYLRLVTEDASGPFVERNFLNFHGYLEHPLRYKVQLVQSFGLYSEDKLLEYEYDFSKPTDAYYALELQKGQYYLLYNPKTAKSYSWGKAPEFYLPGMEHLFQSTHLNNIYFRDNIILTNKVEGLLFLQDKGVPCLALIDNQLSLPTYIEEVILPLYPNRYLLLEYNKIGAQQVNTFTQSNYFTNIITGEAYLNKFFKKGEEAVDRVYDYLEFNDGFKYEGFESPIKRVA